PRASLTDVVPRRTLAIIAAVIALAVLGTVLALSLGGDDTGKDNAGKGKDDTSASAGASTAGSSAGTGGTEQGSGKDQGKGQDGNDGQDKGKDDSGKGSDDSEGDADGKGALPAGYKSVTDKRFHFTMAMPEGFERNSIAGSNSGGIYNIDKGFPRVQIDYNSSPGDDAAAAWNGLKGAVAGSSSGYQHLGIKKVEYNGYPTVADWQFERNENGQRSRILDRGFKVDAKRGYSIMISCKVDEWDGKACKTLRETAFDTFKPLD
ncbi:serine/threonine protein kinase, partial [Streptomyces sp. AC154]